MDDIEKLSAKLAESEAKGKDPTGDHLRLKIKSIIPDPDEPDPIARFYTRVRHKEEKFDHVWKSGHATGMAPAQDAEFNRVSLGWFVTFEGSFESLYFGKKEPDLKIGDSIEVSFRKKSPNDQSQPTSQNLNNKDAPDR